MIIELLKKTVQKLEAIDVPYMLSGSIAMGFYTVNRNTRDIDIVAYLQQKDVDNLIVSFEGDYVYRPTVEEEIRRKGMFNIVSNSTGYKIDMIVLKEDRYSLQAFERKQLLDFEDLYIYVISLEDLIIAKLKWIQQLYSERQFIDMKNLLRNEKIDWEYLQFWIVELRLNTFNLFK